MLLAMWEKCCNIGGGGCNNGCLSLCLLIHKQKPPLLIRIQIPGIWRIRSFLLTLVIVSCAAYFRNLGFAACFVPSGRWLGHCYQLCSSDWLKLTAIYCWSSWLVVAAVNKLRNTKTVISDRFCQCGHCLGGKMVGASYSTILLWSFVCFIVYCTGILDLFLVPDFF